MQLNAAPSDIAIVVDLVLAVILALTFALGRPRTWFRDPLGWVIFYYSLATVALLFLISYAIVVGEKLVEWARLPISIALGFALIWKTVAIIRERHAGRKARAREHERNRS